MKYDTVCAVQGAKHRGSVYKKKNMVHLMTVAVKIYRLFLLEISLLGNNYIH